MTSTLGILNHGKIYLKAAEHLTSEILDGRLLLPFDDPVSLLLGHALELILKASLLQKGATDNEAWGHDLLKLRTTAIAKGCAFTLGEQEKGHLDLLNKVFGAAPYEVRYLKTGPTTVHDDTVIIRIATRFSEEASSLISHAAREL